MTKELDTDLTANEVEEAKGRLKEMKRDSGLIDSGKHIERMTVVRWLKTQARERSFASAGECIDAIASEIEQGQHLKFCRWCGQTRDKAPCK